MDNNTFYLQNFESGSDVVTKQWKWDEYVPKAKEGKKPLPMEYHYFRRKLYSGKSKCFLVLSLRYDDIKDTFRLRINGSLKNWYFNENSLNNLCRNEYVDCMKKIAEKLGIQYDVLLKAKNSKIESGVTVRLNAELKDLLKCFVWYKNFERIEEHETSLYFRGKFYDFIFYEKSTEINSKSGFSKNEFDKIQTNQMQGSYLRFEVKVKGVSGVTFYKKNASTIEKTIENWDAIIVKILDYLMEIKFIDMRAIEKEFKSSSVSDLKKYLMFKGIRDKGIYKTIELLNELNLGTNITKYRNEIFSVYENHVSSDINLRDDLIYEFYGVIQTLIYNKFNHSYY